MLRGLWDLAHRLAWTHVCARLGLLSLSKLAPAVDKSSVLAAAPVTP